MVIFAKTLKGKEFLYSSKTAVLCKNREQAQQVAEFLNSHNDGNQGDFKLKDGEVFHVYEIDKYDRQPLFRLKSTKNSIKICYNI